jgi:ferritin
MITPVKLDDKTVKMLNSRLNDEYDAHYFYRQATNWCENIGFTKAAKYFSQEAADELTHAEGLQKYMSDWNVTATLGGVKTPGSISGLAELIQSAYEIEYDLYEQYEKISLEIFNMSDVCTFDFLKEYRTIQRKSVAEYATLINKLMLIDYNDKNWLANFEQENF